MVSVKTLIFHICVLCVEVFLIIPCLRSSAKTNVIFSLAVLEKKKSICCHQLGVGVGFIIGIGVTNFSLGHISFVIQDFHLKLGICVLYQGDKSRSSFVRAMAIFD